jgi:hypothetical protein
MADISDVWGFKRIVTGGLTTPGPDQVLAALSVGAADRGITETNRPSDALDASRDVIIDDVVFGIVGGLRRANDWIIENDTLYIVWDGMSLDQLRGQ